MCVWEKKKSKQDEKEQKEGENKNHKLEQLCNLRDSATILGQHQLNTSVRYKEPLLRMWLCADTEAYPIAYI